MADTKTTSTTGSAKLTPTDRLIAAHERETARLEAALAEARRERERVTAELAATRERERVAEAPRPAAASTKQWRFQTWSDRNQRFGAILVGLVVGLIILTGWWLYENNTFPISGSWFVAENCNPCNPVPAPVVVPPATVVVETPAPAGLCDLKCLQARVEATCPGTSFKYEGTIVNGMNAEQVIALLKESKNCPTVTPVVVDVPEPRPIIKDRVVYRTKVITKKVVIRRPLPVEEVQFQENLPDAHCSTCNMYNRLNNGDDNIEEPVITRRRRVYEAEPLPQLSQAPAGGVVCVSVLQGEPSALVLRDGPDNTGGAIIGWKPSTIGWHLTRRGYVGRVCFSAAIIANRNVVTLCGAENHSTFRRHHIRELLSRREIPASDPACLLGRSQCARYGL